MPNPPLPKKRHGAHNITAAADNTRVTPAPRQESRQSTIGPAPSRAQRALNVARTVSSTVDAVASAAEAGANLRRGDLAGAAIAGAAVGAALTGAGAAARARRVERTLQQQRIARSIANNRTERAITDLNTASNRLNELRSQGASKMKKEVPTLSMQAEATNLRRESNRVTSSDMHRAENWMRADRVRQANRKKP